MLSEERRLHDRRGNGGEGRVGCQKDVNGTCTRGFSPGKKKKKRLLSLQTYPFSLTESDLCAATFALNENQCELVVVMHSSQWFDLY